MTTKMIALRQTHYGGMNRRKGEIFEVAEEFVSILTAMKAAKPVEEKAQESKPVKQQQRAQN